MINVRPEVNEQMPQVYDKKRTEDVEGITIIIHPCDARTISKQISLKTVEKREGE